MKTTFSIMTALFISVVSAHAQDPINIVFNVNASGYYIGPGGMHIAGLFASAGSTTITADWDPAAGGSEMISTGNGRYSIKVTFPATSAGLDLQFLFVRNDIWNDYTQDYSEGNPGETFLHNGCAVDDVCCGGFNRIIKIPAENAVFRANFDRCGQLSDFSLRTDEDETVSSELKVYPNPASDIITISGLQNDSVVSITDILGHLLWTDLVSVSSPQIDVSHLPAGSYFITMEGSKMVPLSIGH